MPKKGLGAKSSDIAPIRGVDDNITNDSVVEQPKDKPTTLPNESDAMREARENAKLPVSNEDGPKPLIMGHRFESVTLNQIVPDPSNSRTRHILTGRPDHNKLDEAHPDYLENQDTIDSIKMLSDQFKSGVELKQPIGVYIHNGKYHIAYGHRRFFSWKLAYTIGTPIPCKVYGEKPKSIAIARYIENESNEDLPYKAKLLDFKAAYDDAKSIFAKKNEIIVHLGIAKSTFYLNMFILNNPVIYNASLDGKITSVHTAKEIQKLDCSNELIEKLVNYIASAKKKISVKDAYEKVLENQEKNKPESIKPKKAGRRKTFVSLKNLKITQDVLEPVINGIKNGSLAQYNWDDLDMTSLEDVEKRLLENLDSLIKDAHKNLNKALDRE